MDLKKKIKENLISAINDLGYQCEADEIEVTYPPQTKFGDYATNLTFRLAKKEGQSSSQIGEKLTQRVNGQISQGQEQYIERVELAKNGFVNFFLRKALIWKTLTSEVLSQKDSYGCIQTEIDRKVIVEHTAVNPNKELHIGHIRNACIGDILGRVLKIAGCEVEIQNLINDIGVQVTTTLLGLQELEKGRLGIKRGKDERFDTFVSRVYAEITRELEQNPDLQEARVRLHQSLETTQGEDYEKLKQFVFEILSYQVADLAKLNITYDLLVSESSTMEFKLWEKAFQSLKKVKSFVKETDGPNQGTWVVKSQSGNPREDKILVKSDGTITYTGKDVAYHLWKFGLVDFDFLYKEWPDQFNHQATYYTDLNGLSINHLKKPTEIVNVIASEQNYPQQVVKDTLRELGYKNAADNYHHLSYELVALSPKSATLLGVDTSDQRQLYHMSGRKGIGVSFTEFYEKILEKVKKTKFAKTAEREIKVKMATPEEIAVAAIRYYLTKFSYNTTIVFDFDEALSLEGDTGPYLQYAHARAAGILSKAGKVDMHLEREQTQTEINESEWDLIRLMARLPEMVEEVSKTYDVTIMTSYANQMATAFNYFYEKNPVLNAQTPELKRYRLALVSCFKQVMANVLNCLGISAPEAM